MKITEGLKTLWPVMLVGMTALFSTGGMWVRVDTLDKLQFQQDTQIENNRRRSEETIVTVAKLQTDISYIRYQVDKISASVEDRKWRTRQ